MHWRAFLLLTLLVTTIYSNSFYASWHLDDEPNILTNSKIHLTSLSEKSVLAALTANPTRPESSKFYRPVPCLTLALNWYWGRDNTLGYHIVNIAVHAITSFFIFLTTVQLLELAEPSITLPTNKKYFIALLTAALWAAAPLQTQAVTYIIQRMASMAAMFYIIGLYTYILGRRSQGTRRNMLFFLCFIAYLLALGSKENTVILPLALLLIEFTFFQKDKKINKTTYIWTTFFLLASLVGIIFLAWAIGTNPLSFISGYANRSFTLSQRLLTEPRILVQYLVQLLLPRTSSLSIEHQVTVSTSIFTPPTTLAAILFILAICGLSLYYLRKFPLICFPIVFFFLNQLIESTILPLELIFEHRNYLPSSFIFLPVSFLLAKAIYSHNKVSPFLKTTFVVATTMYLLLSGLATYSRNSAWANEGTLWSDALRKAPASARAAHNLGRWYRERGNFQQALKMFQLAYANSASSPSPKRSVLASLNGMASIYFILGQKHKAISLFEQCLQVKKTDEACLKNIALTWTLTGEYRAAYDKANLLTETYPDNPDYLYTKGFIALLAGKYAASRTILARALTFAPDDRKINLALGIALKKLGAYPNAAFFLRNTIQLDKDNVDAYLQLADIYIRMKNTKKTKTIINRTINTFPLPQILHRLSELARVSPGLLATDQLAASLQQEIANIGMSPDKR